VSYGEDLPQIRGFRSVPLPAWALVCTYCERPPPMPVFTVEQALQAARDHLVSAHPELVQPAPPRLVVVPDDETGRADE